MNGVYVTIMQTYRSCIANNGACAPAYIALFASQIIAMYCACISELLLKLVLCSEFLHTCLGMIFGIALRADYRGKASCAPLQAVPASLDVLVRRVARAPAAAPSALLFARPFLSRLLLVSCRQWTLFQTRSSHSSVFLHCSIWVVFSKHLTSSSSTNSALQNNDRPAVAALEHIAAVFLQAISLLNDP